jgi:molecular chaperone GrpE
MDPNQSLAGDPELSSETDSGVDDASRSGTSELPVFPDRADPDCGGMEDPGEDPVSESEVDKKENPVEIEMQKWKNLALRSQADLENYRKRMSREKGEALKFANSALLESLIPILDNFNFGLEAARRENPESVIVQGMEMVYKQMTDFLLDQGVERIATEGQAFDPNFHEALSQAHSDEVPEGIVITEARGGYKLKDRLLRAAQVVVSKGPAKSS